MKLTMLGTGNALVTECYNTCFVIEDKEKYFMVDGGGGNTVLHNLKAANVDFRDIHDIFVTHKHIDHLLGIIWMIRIITQNMNKGNFSGDVNIYAHDELAKMIKNLAEMLLQKKQSDLIGSRVHIIVVKDGEEKEIIGHKVKFFDILSTKAKQFGFIMDTDKGKLTCCGDEPLNEKIKSAAAGSYFLMHEAFCLYSQKEIFKPYEKHHSTVKDACALAEELKVKNVLLYHTEDKNYSCRKELYTSEGKAVFDGNIFVPNDLETIEI